MKKYFTVLILFCSFSISSLRAQDRPLTFSRDIAPIVFEHCSNCHHEGEVAPFSLLSYHDVKKRSQLIEDAVLSRYMPPWKPEPQLNSTTGHDDFLRVRRLDDSDIKKITDWIAQGMVEGDSKDLPATPVYTNGWQLGTPDLVLKMDKPYTVRAEGPDEFRCFVFPVLISEDEYVQAVEFRPSDRKVVHHAIFYLDRSGTAKKLDSKDSLEGYASFGGPGFLPTGNLGGWVPGSSPRNLPEGVAYRLRKGSDLVIQEHFHPTGKPETEQSTIALYFAKKPPEARLMTIIMNSKQIDIAAGQKQYIVRDSFDIPANIRAIGITPHAHYLAKQMRVWADLPDKSTRSLITIDDWDFNWQDQFEYAAPILLPKGTRLHMEFTYDNSTDNIRNPSNPPKRVKHGQQSTDEMAITFLNYLPVSNTDISTLQRATREKMIASNVGSGLAGTIGTAVWNGIMDKLIQRFDVGHKGYLNEDEWEDAIAYLQWKKQQKEGR